MATFHVKICGIKNIADAKAVAEAGADELGFHVGLTGGRSPLSAEEAARIIAALPAGVASVIVTSITDAAELAELARKTGASAMQLYGDAPPSAVQALKAALPALAVWKVVNVAGDAALERAKQYETVADAIVLDTANAQTGARGGSGKTHDWNISRQLVQSLSIPVILAGGLTPDNVAEAVAAAGPAGVDVNSGVSNQDGTKDMEKVRRFIAQLSERRGAKDARS